MTRLPSLQTKSAKLELNQVRSSDSNREGHVGSFQQKVGGIPRQVRRSAPTSLFFTWVTEPCLLSLRDQGKICVIHFFQLQSVTDAGTPSEHCNELISARRIHQVGWLISTGLGQLFYQ